MYVHMSRIMYAYNSRLECACWGGLSSCRAQVQMERSHTGLFLLTAHGLRLLHLLPTWKRLVLQLWFIQDADGSCETPYLDLSG